MKVGMIGLGAMGQGMARNLAKAGRLAALYNRTAEKAQVLAKELGVAVCDSPAQLAATADVVLLCVSADADVLEVVRAMASSVKPGVVVVDMSTVSAQTAQQAAAMLAEKGAHFLDAPVSGGVEGANKGTLSMMVGGETGVLARVQPVLEAMAARIVHMGEVGAGQSTKAVNQIMAAGINQAVAEALAFGQAQGLPLEKVIEVVSGGAAGNWFLQHRGLTMSQGVFNPGFKLMLHHKDLRICLDMAKQVNLALPIARQTLEDYEILMKQEFGEEDISALFRLKRP